ncbi:MAG: L-rhamnose/proton symporter RhaT [Thermoguttaceae bacterium]
MDANPIIGVALFMLGGLAGALFYMPFSRVKQWAWESYWLIYAVVGLIIVPWALALSTSPNLLPVLRAASWEELRYCFLFGAMWGVGGLTWGLMIRYLGVGLGLALGCGLTSAVGTLVPPILEHKAGELYATLPGQISLAGVVVSILGIIVVGMAGMSKERELPEEVKKKSVAEYDFKKGILVAVFSGLMSSGMNIGLQGGQHLQDLAESISPATSPTWRGMPVLVVVLAGGCLVNVSWCLFLNAKNRTFGDYAGRGAPLAANFVFAGLAGAIWCSQFICLKTGEPRMEIIVYASTGQPRMESTAYIGFAVLMASAILFSTVFGILLGEWKGTSRRTRTLLAIGLALLLVSSAVGALSGYAKEKHPESQPRAAAPGLKSAIR